MASYDDDLIEAARNSDMAKMREALALGANPDARDRRGATPLMVLLRSSSRTISQGTTAAETLEPQSDTAVTTAAFFMIMSTKPLTADDRSIVESLLSSGMDINARDNSGATALMCAAASADRPFVELLLEHKADVTLVDNSGGSSLQWAAGTGKADVIKLLLELGADPNVARRLDGVTPLMLEACFGTSESVQALIDAGADVSARSSEGMTALDGAREAGNDATMKILRLYVQMLTHTDCESIGEE